MRAGDLVTLSDEREGVCLLVTFSVRLAQKLLTMYRLRPSPTASWPNSVCSCVISSSSSASSSSCNPGTPSASCAACGWAGDAVCPRLEASSPPSCDPVSDSNLALSCWTTPSRYRTRSSAPAPEYCLVEGLLGTKTHSVPARRQLAHGSVLSHFFLRRRQDKQE